MRILLDQNVPIGVRSILAGHDVRTAPAMGWAALSNGELLDQAENAGFEVMMTADRNIANQQNLSARRLAVVVLDTNRWLSIQSDPQPVIDGVRRAVAGSFTTASFARPRRRGKAPSP